MFAEKSVFQHMLILHEATNAFDLVSFHHQLQTLFTAFLYHEFYLFSYLQTLDIYVLMCKPFQYKEFQKSSHLLKLIFKGSLFCMLIVSTYLIRIPIKLYLASVYDAKTIFRAMIRKMLISKWIVYIDEVKFLILKIVHFVSVAKMAYSIRKCFDESSKLVTKNSNHTLKRRVCNFALIPVLINILFGIHEGIRCFSNIFQAVKLPQKNFNCSEDFIIKRDVVVCLTAINLTIGSIVYFVGYNALYAKLRGLCRSCSNRAKSI